MGDDTRDIAMRAQSDAAAALGAVHDLKESIDKLRAENTEQHKEARSLIGDGLAKVHARLNQIILGGWGVLLGLLAYVLAYGPPWVTHGQLKDVLEHIK